MNPLEAENAALRAQLAQKDIQIAVAHMVADSLSALLNIATDDDFGDLEERLQAAFGREDIIQGAHKALARFTLLQRSMRKPGE